MSTTLSASKKWSIPCRGIISSAYPEVATSSVAAELRRNHQWNGLDHRRRLSGSKKHLTFAVGITPQHTWELLCLPRITAGQIPLSDECQGQSTTPQEYSYGESDCILYNNPSCTAIVSLKEFQVCEMWLQADPKTRSWWLVLSLSFRPLKITKYLFGTSTSTRLQWLNLRCRADTEASHMLREGNSGCETGDREGLFSSTSDNGKRELSQTK